MRHRRLSAAGANLLPAATPPPRGFLFAAIRHYLSISAAPNVFIFIPPPCRTAALADADPMDNRDADRDGLNKPSGGRAEQVAALFREHHRALLAFLQCRLASPADAQEVAQEVYVRLLAMGEEARIETPRAFLFRVAANLAVDRARMQAVRAKAPPDPEPEDWHAAPVPERHAAALQQWQDIREALRELPAKTSRAFVMHAIEGRDYGAIARAMNLSERMVRYHVSHAMNHCRARCYPTETP